MVPKTAFALLVLVGSIALGTTPGDTAASTPVATPAGECLDNRVVSMSVPTPAESGAYSYSQGNFDYIVSDDGQIAVHADPGFHVGGNKFGFNKPNGSTAQVTGRLLDGSAPPLGVSQFPPGSYPLNFEVMGLWFPAPGCWEVTIDAGSSHLRFTAPVVGNSSEATPDCSTLATLVAGSDVIFVGTVSRRDEHADGSAWVSLAVSDVIGWRVDGPSSSLNVGSGGMPFTGYFLFEPIGSSVRLATGTTYLVFASGVVPSVACPAASLAIIEPGIAALQPVGDQPLWSSIDLPGIKAEIAQVADPD